MCRKAKQDDIFIINKKKKNLKMNIVNKSNTLLVFDLIYQILVIGSVIRVD